MSNLGFQAVCRLFAEQPRFAIERAFLPDEPAHQGSERSSARIAGFENSTQLSSAEILALSVSFETDYPHVLRFIQAAGRGLGQCRELSPSAKPDLRFRPFVLGGGAALTLNPEPLANFFDAIVIGEAEELIQEFSEIYVEARDAGASLEDTLLRLSTVEGIYVPTLHTPKYAEDGTIASIERQGSVAVPRRRFVKDLDSFPTTTVIQTPDTEFKSMFMTETGRGCEVGCKFCVAGYMYRPIRKRSAEVIAETVRMGVETSDSIGFVGAAVSSHPKISELASSVAQLGKRAALSSIMTQRVTEELAGSLSESEYKTVALAPEAGSEALRFRIGKRVCNEQILAGIAKLAHGGIRNFKLYFMVGLPSEEVSDVDEIPKLVAQAREVAHAEASISGRKVAPRLVLSVNPFIPKAWTPFQRHGFLPMNELNRRLKSIRNSLKRLPNVEMKNESPRESYFQAVMSRGDRRVGDLLIAMQEQGRDWRWLVKNGDREIVAGVPNADFYVFRTIAANELLPWEVVDLRIKRSLLERQYERTFTEDVAPMIARAREVISTEPLGCSQ